ncbi:MAG: MFS transporter [Acetobacteraceae bacterium]|nr:MFS transporter [Acetobacteraceae bacterium]
MRPWVILSALALARIAFGYQFQTVATLGPALVPLFNLTYAEFGALIGAYMLLGAFAALPLGVLGRQLGDRLVLGVGLVLMVIGACISAWSGGPAGIATGRTLAGVGAVAMIVLQNKIIADWFSGQRFMVAISVSVCAYPIGVGLAQLILPALTERFGWPSGFLSGGFMVGAALLMFLASFRPAPQTAPPRRRFSWPSRREWLRLVVAGLIWTAYTAGYSGYTSYVPSMLVERGQSLALVALVMTFATWGNVPATMFGGGLAVRFGGFRIFVAGTAALVVGMTGTALMNWPVTWSFVVGVLGSVHPGVIMAIGTLSARPGNRAVGMGIFYSIYYAGNALTPALCGRAADWYGGPAGGVLAAAVFSALALPVYLLHRRIATHETMLARA